MKKVLTKRTQATVLAEQGLDLYNIAKRLGISERQVLRQVLFAARDEKENKVHTRVRKPKPIRKTILVVDGSQGTFYGTP
jgi:DNA-binding transcriptional regulator LsrR (DeoR family)